MSYNWQSVATPQGRERLKELLDAGHRIIGKVGEFGRITALWKSDGGAYDIDGYISESMFHKARLDDIEFLDPDPPQPKPDENGLLPCPFCGGKAHHLITIRFDNWIGCDSCGASTAHFREANRAFAAWNRRQGKEGGV